MASLGYDAYFVYRRKIIKCNDWGDIDKCQVELDLYYLNSGDASDCDYPDTLDWLYSRGMEACIVEPEPTTDEQCLALNDEHGDKMIAILDFDPAGIEFELPNFAPGCKFQYAAGVTPEVGGMYHAQFSAIGATDAASGSTDSIDVSDLEAPEGGTLASSDDYTPTSDPETDCQYSNVILGGETYCYTGEYAPQDASYPDGSVRVDNPDGSYDIVEPDGTTTEYNAEGGLKSPGSAPGTADGEEYGEDADGIIGAISSLKKAVNGGFDGVVDKLTGKADELKDELTEDAPNASDLISDSNLDEVSDQVDQAATDHTDDVLEKLDEIGDDDSSPIADQVTSHLPSLPGSSCSPLNFGTEPFAFTISCEIFTKFRNWFGWLLYFWTAVSIIDIFFAPTTRRA